MADNQPYNDESTAFINQLKELYKAGKYKEASELFRDFLNKNTDKDSPEFRELMNEVLGIATSFNPQDATADSYYILGCVYNELENYEKGIENSLKAIELDSISPFAYNNRGISYHKLEQYDKAIADYSKAIKIDNNYDAPYINRADTYIKLKQYDKAIADYTSIVEHSKDTELYHSRAYAYYELKQYDKSIADYSKIIELDPQNVSAYIRRGVSYNELQQNEKAISDYSKAIELDPQNAHAYNNRGVSYDDLQQYDKAIADYSKAITLDLESALYYSNRGVSYDGLEQYDKAIEDFSKAIELNPEYDNAFRNRASTYAELKQYDNAIADYTRIIIYSKNGFFINLAKSKLEEIEKQKDAEEYRVVSNLVEEIKSLLVFQGNRVTHYSSLSTARILIFDKNNEQNKNEKDKKEPSDNRNKFRLSEGSFLNDTSEGQVLFDFLEMKEKSLSKSVAEAKVFIEKPFIGSFVADTKSDDLALWRMYGKEAQEEAKGCSITIDSKKFLEDLKAAYIPSDTDTKMPSDTATKMAPGTEKENIFQFFRVAYLTKDGKPKFIIPGGIKRNENKLNELLVQLKQKMANLPATIKEKTKNNIKEKLEEIAYLFKSIEYQYEHEVRLIVNLSTIFTRQINTNRTPPGVYIKLVDILPSVCRITLGPKVVLADEWAAALHYDITNKGHKVEVFVSHLPYK